MECKKSEMKIQKIAFSDVEWQAKKPPKYLELYNSLHKLELGNAIKVGFCEPVSLHNILNALVRRRKLGYKFKIKKLDKENRLWAIAKVKR